MTEHILKGTLKRVIVAPNVHKTERANSKASLTIPGMRRNHGTPIAEKGLMRVGNRDCHFNLNRDNLLDLINHLSCVSRLLTPITRLSRVSLRISTNHLSLIDLPISRLNPVSALPLVKIGGSPVPTIQEPNLSNPVKISPVKKLSHAIPEKEIPEKNNSYFTWLVLRGMEIPFSLNASMVK
ncbi:hypothetical protein SDC9_185809 [bioreactor metagenome]|uniref:Uncharacterized protein n=1 Tax=bioreactor metagenome TaxID=1076179 RepID=A0A645HGW7_9ZZZZ